MKEITSCPHPRLRPWTERATPTRDPPLRSTSLHFYYLLFSKPIAVLEKPACAHIKIQYKNEGSPGAVKWRLRLRSDSTLDKITRNTYIGNASLTAAEQVSEHISKFKSPDDFLVSLRTYRWHPRCMLQGNASFTAAEQVSEHIFKFQSP
jgi:hypothetical protein